MRIKRDVVESRIKIIGHVKVGMVTKNAEGKEFPKSLDYFHIDSGTTDPLYAQNVLKALGTVKPRTLHIVFVSDDDNINCDERYELIVKKRIYAYGDGETFFERGEKDDGFKMYPVDQFPKIKDDILARGKKLQANAEWSEVLRLRFLILEYRDVVALWQFTTHGSASSIKEIVSNYEMVKKMTGGRVRGIPFDMNVKMVKSGKVGASHKFPVVSIMANLSYDNLNKLEKLTGEGRNITGIITNELMDDIEPTPLIEFKEQEPEDPEAMINGAKTLDELAEAVSVIRKMELDPLRREHLIHVYAEKKVELMKGGAK
ncbi:hypothetical protein [Candidatus Magnetobacterium casense]|uniref:Uncharacterized protein n=1 Tax=Candidatus Magnetobacterium casense TaxID=1455061 RepID=A0ABS6S0G2_9BACT|nr:hypothetical protein [Candidatus Magnetobacterium casensis]MBV6342345.1 hypothetical protein [Candidatus Magnetobacterium casensis]